MQRSYPGTEIRDGVLHFQPRLPAAVEQVEFWMQFQRTPLLVSLDRDRLTLTVHREGAGGPIRIAVGDRPVSSAPARPKYSSCPHGRGRRARELSVTRAMAPFQGAIFDVDGVLVDSPHEKAWRESLRE